METFPVHSVCIRPEQINHSFENWKRHVLPGYTYYIKENETCVRLIEYMMSHSELPDIEKKLSHYIEHIFHTETHRYHILRYPLATANATFLSTLLQNGASTKGHDIINHFPETPLLMYLVCFLQDNKNINYESCLLLLLQNGCSFQEEVFTKYRLVTFFTKEHMQTINHFVTKYKDKIPAEQILIWQRQRMQRILS